MRRFESGERRARARAESGVWERSVRAECGSESGERERERRAVG